jgi:hypothetical protein
MIKKPRVNKPKEVLVEDIQRKQRVERQKVLARLMFPFIEGLPTIYDAQTVVTALAGFIKADVARKMTALVVKDLTIDLSKEEDGPIKAAIIALQGLLQTENADDAAVLLERFGNGLGQFAAEKYMKNPMNVVVVDEFVA